MRRPDETGALERSRVLVRRALDRLSRRMGRSQEPRDCRHLDLGPLVALYRYGARGVIANVPLARCRTFGALAIPPTSQAGHPYVLTAQMHLAGGDADYAASPLKAYYEAVQPRTAAEFLGLPNDATETLGRMEAIEADLPWAGTSGPHVRAQRARFMERDSAAFGQSMGLEYGWSFVGPVSAEKGGLEIDRTVAIVDAIAREGYQAAVPADHGWGYLLRDGSDYTCLIWGGQHRVSALAALGYDNMPLLLCPQRIAERRHAGRWPAVRAGLVTKDQALQVFDRVMAGRLPRQLEARWPDAWHRRPGGLAV